MFRPLMRTRLLLVALLPLLACSSGRVSFTGEIRYAKTAQENYEAGIDEMKNENWLEAGKFFEHVRTKYPFPKYAALAELGQADSKFLQSRYPEAADAYTRAIAVNPANPRPRMRLIGVASELKRFDVAEREARTLLTRNYRPSRMYLTLGGFAQLQGRNAEAAQHYRDALRLEPGLTMAAEALRQLR